jgi:hypothetical protein
LITVMRRSFATRSAPIQATAVIRSMTRASWLVKKAATRRANTGSLAPQFMKGAVSSVASRSRGDFRVRVAITPGTAHPPAMPPETTKAITELPCRPKARKTRSSM